MLKLVPPPLRIVCNQPAQAGAGARRVPSRTLSLESTGDSLGLSTGPVHAIVVATRRSSGRPPAGIAGLRSPLTLHVGLSSDTVHMKYFRELRENARLTGSLQPRYYWLTTAVGLLAIAVGIPMILLVADSLGFVLGFSLDDRLAESQNSAAWAALFFLSIPLVFCATTVVVAWLATFPMRWFGAMHEQDVKFYVLRGRYPGHWLKE